MTNVVRTQDVLRTLLELRGEGPGHRYHGNQWGRGRGRVGGDEPSGAGPTSAPRKQMSRKEALEALKGAGYTGPTSFSVTRLNEIHAAHTATQGHPPADRKGVSSVSHSTKPGDRVTLPGGQQVTITSINEPLRPGAVSFDAKRDDGSTLRWTVDVPKTPKLTTQGVRKAIEESIASGEAHGGLDAKVKMAEKINVPNVAAGRSYATSFSSGMSSGVQTKMSTGSHPDLPGYNHKYVDVTMNFSSKGTVPREKLPEVTAQRRTATKNVMGAVAKKGYRVHQGDHDVPFHRFQVYEAT